MVDHARHTLWQWQDAGKIDPICADQWEEVLSESVADVRRMIGEDSQSGRDLRQTPPSPGCDHTAPSRARS